MTTETKARAWDSYSTFGEGYRIVRTGLYVEATPKGLHLSINDRDPKSADDDDDDEIADVTLTDDAAASLLRACWHYLEMTGRDPLAAIEEAPGSFLSERVAAYEKARA